MKGGSKGWIAPMLSGGIGNRLFQYAAAAGIAERTGRELVFSVNRNGLVQHGAIDDFYNLFPSVPKRTDNPVKHIKQDWGEHCHYVPFIDDPSAHSILIEGAYQSEKHFPKNGIHANLPPVNEAILKKYRIRETPHWFLHIRLGDYIGSPLLHVNMENYYRNCLRRLPPNANVLVFSNGDPTPFLNYFRNEFPSIRFEFMSDNLRDVDILSLMRECSAGAICPNSTFSWWGSYFAHQKHGGNHKVFMPSQWFGVGQYNYPTEVQASWAEKVDV